MRRYYPYGRFSTQFIILYWLFRGPQMVATARAQRRVAHANPNRHAEGAERAKKALFWVVGGGLAFYLLMLLGQS